jgi:hypothetical protein
VLDTRYNKFYFVDHKTTKKTVKSQYYMEWHTIAPQMTGYTWLGEYVTDFLREGGQLPDDTEYGGVILNSMQSSPKIECACASIPLPREPYHIEQFIRHTYQLGCENLERRAKTALLHEQGIPLEAAWPHWASYDEGWCDWCSINHAPDEETRDKILATCGPRKRRGDDDD